VKQKSPPERDLRTGETFPLTETVVPPIVPSSDLRKKSDVLAATEADLRTLGLVGETDAALLVYVAYSSRKLARPLCVIVKGPSGSGKDQVQRIPARLIPPADVHDFISITPNALYYGEPGWLRHKVVLGGERRHEDTDEGRDKTAAIRQMISQGYISKATTRSVGGIHQTETVRQDGPISYSETTTQDSIFREDANRCLQVTTNVSREQTRAVVTARTGDYLPGTSSVVKRRDEAIRRHHEFQNALRDVEVRIPFARALGDLLPDDVVDIRRIVSQLLTVVECVTYLHQFVREPDRDGTYRSTLEDYEIARRLSEKPLAESRKTEGEESKVLDSLSEQFTTSALKEAMDTESRMKANRLAEKLEAAGLIKMLVKAKGPAPTTWVKTGRTAPKIILPTADQVREAFGG